MDRDRTRAVLAAALLILFAGAGCGGDDDTPAEAAEPVPTATVQSEADRTDPEPAATDADAVPTPPDDERVEFTAPGVEFVEVTFVDDSRATPSSFSDPGSDSRSLRTLIAYPADADPDTAVEAVPSSPGTPYPLVLFAHGLYSTPEGYLPFIAALADAGHVVVAPEFPRTSAKNRGGPDRRDNGNQPGDISFLIDSVTDLAADADGELAGLVDTERIVMIGHSNGAHTTYGLVANTCCRDDRIDVAVLLAGEPAPFDGEYDFGDVVPMLFVHGTADALIPYEAAVEMFDDLATVKGLLTLRGGDHSLFLIPRNEFFDDTVATTVDFVAYVLDDDPDAGARLTEPRAAADADLVVAG